MIQDRHAMSRADALALLERSEVIHVAASGELPLLRPLHGVLVDGGLAWHCSLRGKKDAMLGRRVQVAAHEKVAEIPSHFRHPENACPATTYYESVLAEGVPAPVVDPGEKARILQALMEKYQPEGGHRPIRSADERYLAPLKSVQVVAMRVDRIVGKSKLGQNRTPAERISILTGLWHRGRSGDLAAIDRILGANPDTPRPAFLAAPDGFRLRCAPDGESRQALPGLLAGQYWTRGESLERLAAAHGLNGWATLEDDRTGETVASGRVLGDGHRMAWILDLVVERSLQRRGLGSALLRLLLDHPLARTAARVRLRTHDAHGIYHRFGFRVEKGDVLVLRRESGD